MPRRSGLVLVAVMLSACGLAERSPNPTASATSGQPTPPDCSGPDVTLSELIALRRGAAGPDCFGDSLLTLRGWVWEDRGAYDCVADWAVPGDPLPPDWLYCAATNHARLTPVSYPPGEPLPGFIRPGDGPFFFAVDPASPAAEVVRPNRWVEVVGRFDDPITGMCELVGDPTFRDECLSTFVVREARVIEAPGASGPPAASAFPTPTDILPPQSLARVIVNDLRIREGPSLTGKVVATVGVGEILWTGGFASRRQADGIDWYSVSWRAGYSAWPLSRGGEPGFSGWVALGVGDRRYLELQAPRCPDGDPGLDQLAVITDWERLACFGGNALTLTGTFGCYGCGGTAAGTFEPAWLASPFNSAFLSVKPEVELGPLVLNFAPGSGIVPPPDGSTVRVTAHMNDPASATCEMGLAGEIEANRRMAELFCRERFVVDALEVTGTDPDFPVS